eukprot:4699006-Pyramimonas_sp.AAC.1
MMKHLKSVSGAPGQVGDAVLQRGLPTLLTYPSLGEVPTKDGVRCAILEMRESAAGKGEIAIPMIRNAGEELMSETITI